MSDCRSILRARIADRGPLTFAEFMAIALYDHECGYYARASRRSGRAGDFFTSVDVGPLFGQLLARQLAEMWRLLGSPDAFDLVEAGAGDGRLARDVLEAAAAGPSGFYAAIRLHLVERSARARAEQPATLGRHASRLASRGDTVPPALAGALVANELLDAMPVHLVAMREEGLHEVYVDVAGDAFVEREGLPSTPRLAEYLAAAGVSLAPGWRGEINLAATDWVAGSGRALSRGFMILVDYGHEARDLYSASHAAGTLTSYRAHVSETVRPGAIPWLDLPGSGDITSHVDFTSVRLAAEAAGLKTLALVDQTYFLLGLGLADLARQSTGDAAADLKRRLALKTLMLPGGLGSTHKVLILGKDVGTPVLRATAASARLT